MRKKFLVMAMALATATMLVACGNGNDNIAAEGLTASDRCRGTSVGLWDNGYIVCYLGLIAAMRPCYRPIHLFIRRRSRNYRGG